MRVTVCAGLYGSCRNTVGTIVTRSSCDVSIVSIIIVWYRSETLLLPVFRNDNYFFILFTVVFLMLSLSTPCHHKASDFFHKCCLTSVMEIVCKRKKKVEHSATAFAWVSPHRSCSCKHNASLCENAVKNMHPRD